MWGFLIYLSTAFDTVSDGILDKKSSIQLDMYTIRWMKNRLKAQRVEVKGIIPGWEQVTSSVPQGSTFRFLSMTLAQELSTHKTSLLTILN